MGLLGSQHRGTRCWKFSSSCITLLLCAATPASHGGMGWCRSPVGYLGHPEGRISLMPLWFYAGAHTTSCFTQVSAGWCGSQGIPWCPVPPHQDLCIPMPPCETCVSSFPTYPDMSLGSPCLRCIWVSMETLTFILTQIHPQRSSRCSWVHRETVFPCLPRCALGDPTVVSQ